jgi:hypothetical protein
MVIAVMASVFMLNVAPFIKSSQSIMFPNGFRNLRNDSNPLFGWKEDFKKLILDYSFYNLINIFLL